MKPVIQLTLILLWLVATSKAIFRNWSNKSVAALGCPECVPVFTLEVIPEFLLAVNAQWGVAPEIITEGGLLSFKTSIVMATQWGEPSTQDQGIADGDYFVTKAIHAFLESPGLAAIGV